ncbi:MAG TPA: transglutaminaseTgpA domain-containing protein [Acidimicrobiia bacterium]|nr:transglutaminaseTgpA domain-containing protein [Acidimicrobiia bacterium]
MASRARFFAPFALAALTAAAGLSLGRVFASDRFVVPVLVAVVLAHASGALARRFSWPTWALVLLQVGVLALFVVVVFGQQFTAFGITLGGSVHTIPDQLERGLDLLRSAPPPAPVTDGALLLAALATFVVGAVADALAFRRQTVLAATAPALVLFVWAVTLGTSADRMLTVVGFAVAAAVFVLLQNLAVLDRGRSWLVSREAPRRHWLAPAAALIAIALAVGVVLAPILPGAGADPVLDFANNGGDGAGGSYRTGVAPFVDVSAKLNDTSDPELFTVTADHADYWRVAALDQFSSASGGQWTLRAEGDEVEVGLPQHGPDDAFHQAYAIGPMGERWLPAAYRPVAIDLDDTLVVRSSSTLVADTDSIEGLRYEVDSITPPTASEISPAMQSATATPVPDELTAFTELPDGMPDVIATTANEIVTAAGATTPYAQAAALRDWFRKGDFAYDLTVDPADTPDAIAQFLEHKRGFCVQFSTAFAVMARSLGIPTRVAVGFTPGDEVDGVFHVSAHDAHAWPEVWLAGIGWTHLFDPTPPASDVADGGSALPDEAQVVPPANASGGTLPATTVPPAQSDGTGNPTGTAATGTGTVAPTPAPVTPEVTTEQPGSSRSPWFAVLLLLLAIVAVFVAYVVAVAVVGARRRSHRRDGAPTDAVQGAWDDALDQLRLARVATDPALTPLELARVVPERTPAAEQPLRDLARQYTAARYSAAVPTPDDATRAWESADALAAALDTDVGWRERLRRRLDPGALTRVR